jgi:hypothetical protein
VLCSMPKSEGVWDIKGGGNTTREGVREKRMTEKVRISEGLRRDGL